MCWRLLLPFYVSPQAVYISISFSSSFIVFFFVKNTVHRPRFILSPSFIPSQLILVRFILAVRVLFVLTGNCPCSTQMWVLLQKQMMQVL